MRRALAIAKRELRSGFDSSLAYVVICVSLVLLGFVFFFLDGGFWQRDRASVQGLFTEAARGLSLLVVPVVTMRLVAEEHRSGTFEMLITLPVRDHEVVLGKFLGAWALVLILIASTLAYPLLMFWYPWHLGELDAGPVHTGYLGLVVYSAAAVAVGLLVSALTESQVVAGIVTFSILFVAHAIGFAGGAISSSYASDIIAFVAFDARLASFSKGIIDTRDVIYFISITLGCLTASVHALERRKWA